MPNISSIIKHHKLWCQQHTYPIVLIPGGVCIVLEAACDWRSTLYESKTCDIAPTLGTYMYYLH